MQKNRSQLVGFFLVLSLFGLLALFIWLPFFRLFAGGAILAILFYPMQKRIAHSLGHHTAVALISLIIILFIILVPVYLVGQVVFNELINFYQHYKSSGASLSQAQVLQNLPVSLRAVVQNLLNNIGQHLTDAAGNIFGTVGQVFSNIGTFFLGVVLVFLTTFYLLRDGENIKVYFAGILPLSEQHQNLLVNRLSSAVSGLVKGQILVGLLQAALASIAFSIFGIPQPLLWGLMVGLAAQLPAIGMPVSFISAISFLLLTGHLAAGIGLTIWAILSISLVDNVVAPKIVGREISLHPLLMIFSVLGGIKLFGFVGLLLGPILVSIFITLLDVYRKEFKAIIE